ncbi:hypothetical protein G3N57_03240 [Paraburkholderia sp. Se-20369]|nr:hypothetical protein [Paraburkholderia sp. Se-20369]
MAESGLARVEDKILTRFAPTPARDGATVLQLPIENVEAFVVGSNVSGRT